MSTDPALEISEEDQASHKRWVAAAMCLGYNELAKIATVLGEKVYWRLARDAAENHFVELGGNKIYKEESSVLELEIPDAMLRIKFREQDIELMRATLAAHDEGRAVVGYVVRYDPDPNVFPIDDYDDDEPSQYFVSAGVLREGKAGATVFDTVEKARAARDQWGAVSDFLPKVVRRTRRSSSAAEGDKG